MKGSRRCVLALLLAGAVTRPAAAAPERGLCGAAGTSAPVVVLSAFPAELAPLVKAATVEQTVEVDGRRYHLGRLEGVRVVLGLTGIGMVNAATITATVIRTFKPAGIVMSGVAGSSHRIADVVVAAHWVEQSTERVFPVNPALLEIARRGAAALPTPLETCTPVPPTSATGALVCMPFEPAVVFVDAGKTDDPYGGNAFPCAPGGGEVFGCEVPEPAVRLATQPATAASSAEVEDMETTAVARVAKRHRVPFVAMRAVSDGAGDPKGDRGFPAQFFDYYRLSADNAALVTRAFLAELTHISQDPATRRICRLLKQHRWRRAGALLGGASASSTATPE